MEKINFTGEINTTENNTKGIVNQIKNFVNQHKGKVDIQITTELDITRLKERISDCIEQCFSPDEDGSIEIYCDYRDELSKTQIKEIMQSENPREKFQDILWDYDDWSEWDGLFEYIRSRLNEEEKEMYINNQTEINDWLYEKYSFHLPEEHFNKSVKVNIMLDTGNMNYDFTCDNVLNWDGRFSNGEFDRNSSMLWLAEQQGKSELLKRCCRESMLKWELDEQEHKETTECEDGFIISAMHELANLTCHMGTMTFLVDMTLFDLFKIHEAIKAESELNESYHLEDRKGTGYIVLDKSTMCGLFNTWQGGGSLLEVECENDIVIPIKCIFDAVVDGTNIYGWDVDSVYSLVGTAWQPTLKEIYSM